VSRRKIGVERAGRGKKRSESRKEEGVVPRVEGKKQQAMSNPGAGKGKRMGVADSVRTGEKMFDGTGGQRRNQRNTGPKCDFKSGSAVGSGGGWGKNKTCSRQETRLVVGVQDEDYPMRGLRNWQNPGKEIIQKRTQEEKRQNEKKTIRLE